MYQYIRTSMYDGVYHTPCSTDFSMLDTSTVGHVSVPGRLAISNVSDPSGSGRVDMLTGPVAAARAVVATGAWVKSKHGI